MRLIKSTSIGVLSKVISIVGALIIIPLMLKKLGHSNYGIWLTISSAISMLGFMDFGISSNLMSFIAMNRKNTTLIRSYIFMSYVCQLVVVIIASMIIMLIFNFIDWKSWFHLQTLSRDILLSMVIMFLFFMAGLVSNTIYAIQRGMQQNVVANTWQLIANLCSIVFLFFALQKSNTISLIAFGSFGIPVCIALINTILYLRKYQLFKPTFKGIKLKETFGFFKVGIVILYLQIVATFAFQTDTIILAHYMTYEDVSKFSVVARIFAIPAMLINIYFQALWPAYTHAYSSNNWKWIKRTFLNSSLYTIALTIFFCVFVYFSSNLIFHFWLKTNWSVPLGMFIAFSIWTIISIMDGNIAIILNGLQLFKVQVILSFFMVISNLMLSIFLVSKCGIQGVIWGSIFSTFIFSLAPFVLYIRKLLKTKINASEELAF